jgi:hypothetical protein
MQKSRRRRRRALLALCCNRLEWGRCSPVTRREMYGPRLRSAYVSVCCGVARASCEARASSQGPGMEQLVPHSTRARGGLAPPLVESVCRYLSRTGDAPIKRKKPWWCQGGAHSHIMRTCVSCVGPATAARGGRTKLESDISLELNTVSTVVALRPGSKGKAEERARRRCTNVNHLHFRAALFRPPSERIKQVSLCANPVASR